MNRPLGVLRDPPGTERGISLRHLVAGSVGAVPSAFSLADRITAGLDQYKETCVGAALYHGLKLAAHTAGFDIDPSYRAIHTIARMLEDLRATRLPDRGCYPHLALEGLEDWGVVARTRWPDDSDIGAPVPIDVLEAGAVARVTGVYRVFETGDELVALLRRSIFEGHGAFYAGSVGAAYKRLGGEVYDGDATSDGDHARLLVGYRPGAFLELNSWGLGWGEGGFGWISEAYVRRAFAHTVITAAPMEVV